MEPSARDERRDQLLNLYSDLQEVENEISQHTKERDRLRNEISILVAEHNGPVILPGVARMELTAPSITRSYDRAGIDQVIRDLTSAGEFEIAQRLIACQKESQRAGSLRILPERKKAT